MAGGGPEPGDPHVDDEPHAEPVAAAARVRHPSSARSCSSDSRMEPATCRGRHERVATTCCNRDGRRVRLSRRRRASLAIFVTTGQDHPYN